MNNSKNSYFFWVFYFFSKEFLVIFPAFKQVKIIIVKKMIKKWGVLIWLLKKKISALDE